LRATNTYNVLTNTRIFVFSLYDERPSIVNIKKMFYAFLQFVIEYQYAIGTIFLCVLSTAKIHYFFESVKKIKKTCAKLV